MRGIRFKTNRRLCLRDIRFDWMSSLPDILLFNSHFIIAQLFGDSKRGYAFGGTGDANCARNGYNSAIM